MVSKENLEIFRQNTPDIYNYPFNVSPATHYTPCHISSDPEAAAVLIGLDWIEHCHHMKVELLTKFDIVKSSHIYLNTIWLYYKHDIVSHQRCLVHNHRSLA